MKILLSIHSLGIGGVQTYLVQLANGLSVNHQVWVYTHYPYTSSNLNINKLGREIVLENPASNFVLDKFIWKVNSIQKNLLFKPSAWEKYRAMHFLAVLKRNNIEAIISFDRYSDYTVTQLKDKHNLPILLSLHGNYDVDSGNPWNVDELIQFREIFQKIDGIVYKTDENVRLIKEMSPFPNILVMQKILHGFAGDKEFRQTKNLKSEFSIAEGVFVFSMMARGDPSKGWQEALEAYVKLGNSPEIAGNNVVFLCLGNGQYMEELKEKFSNNQNIIFLPENTDPLELAQITDVGVLPTHFKTENYSYTVIEYLFAGKPVIAALHGKIPESLSAGDEFAGILIPKGPDGKVEVLQLVAAMKLLLQQKEIYNHLKDLTGMAFEKFTPEHSIAAYEMVLEKILSGYRH